MESRVDGCTPKITKTPPEGVMKLPPTMGDNAPLPPPDEGPPEEPYEPSEPYDPSELLGPGDLPDELDLHSPAEIDPGHDEIPGEGIGEIFPDIYLLRYQQGGPGNSSKASKKTSKMNLSKVSGQDDQDPGEENVVEKGNSTSGEFSVRSVSLNHLKKVKEDQRWGVVGAIKNELTSVPVDPMHGYIQGQVLQLLRENHEESAEVTEERRVCHMRVCAAQAGGTGGEEQLQTVTVPLHKVRKGKMVWFHAREVQISDREADPMPSSMRVGQMGF